MPRSSYRVNASMRQALPNASRLHRHVPGDRREALLILLNVPTGAVGPDRDRATAAAVIPRPNKEQCRAAALHLGIDDQGAPRTGRPTVALAKFELCHRVAQLDC